ncbi:MAG: FtsX-like permease family protein [Chitinophagaceae bacterium]
MFFRIAWRYLMGKKNVQAVQLISWVSIIAIMIGTAALLVVLSVYNGFDLFIKSLYSDFASEILITPQKGKTFSEQTKLFDYLKSNKAIAYYSKCLEEKIVLTYNEKQVICTVKGIDSMYDKTVSFQKNILYGTYKNYINDAFVPLVLGIGVSNKLGANEQSGLPILAYSFNDQQRSVQLDMLNAYYTQHMVITGIFSLQEEVDNHYGFVPLDAMKKLLNKPHELSSISIKLKKGANMNTVSKQLTSFLNAYGLESKTRYEQNKTLYKILKSERWAVFLILTFMLIIASFNIIGSLSMLVIEKEKDVAILQTLGMNKWQIQKIFLLTGMYIALIGMILGFLVAVLLCMGQQYFGWIKLGSSGSFLIENYPVHMQVSDFVVVFVLVLLISFFASLIPSRKATEKTILLRTAS